MPFLNGEAFTDGHDKQSEWKVEDVLKQLTLEEKVLLLTGRDFWHTNAIPRLNVPSIRLSDGPNGVRGTKFFGSVPSSCLPCGTAIGATFDTKLATRIGNLLADEAKAKGAHVVLGPTINIQRGPLGGRGFESFSEDPLLSGLLAASYCKGMQQKNIVPTLKHFVCNDQEHERMAVNSIVTDRALREIYLMPFMIAIREASPEAIMTAYNKVNGIHAAEHKDLLQSILRHEWDWNGLLMSDWFGTYSTTEAITAGLDLEMPGPSRWRGPALVHAVSANKISVKILNSRVRNLLNLVKKAEKAGIKENAPESELDRAEDRELLRKVSAESIVLLKNEDKILPLDDRKRVAIIGPNSKIAAYCGGGSASLNAYRTVTPYEGITAQASAGTAFAQGAFAHQMLPQMGPQLRTESGKIGFTMKFFNDPPGAKVRHLLEERHLVDASVLFLDYDHPDLKRVWYADASGIFTPSESGSYEFGLCVQGTAKLYVNGQLLVDNTENQRQGSSFLGNGTLEEIAAIDLSAGQEYEILVQWGCAKTSKLRREGTLDFGHGGLRFGVCKKISQQDLIEEAVKLASQVGQVVLCAGLNGEWESEGDDRKTMDLPPGSDELITRVLAVNPNTVVVLQSGTPVTLPWMHKAKAVIHAWYGGNETGHAIADVLFGTVNPSGKLPLSWPRRIQDNPSYLNFRSEGGRVLYGEDVYVGYRYFDSMEIAPAFPFGHGLSYTTFTISDLVVEAEHTTSETIRISCRVTNTGCRKGAEVVQVYVAPPESPVNRPPKELRGFNKVELEAGESDVVEIHMNRSQATSFWHEKCSSWCSFAGTYKILVSNTSVGDFLEGSFNVGETKFWTGL